MDEANQSSPESKADTVTTRNNVIVFRNGPACSIVEILSPKDNSNDNDPERSIEAYCIHVEPRACSGVVKKLSSALPLEDFLLHLKRVRRRPLPSPTFTETSSKSSFRAGDGRKICSRATGTETTVSPDRSQKRRKPNFVLEILIGTQPLFHSKNKSVEDHPIVLEFGELYPVVVPKYEPRSEQEWKMHNALWPTLYHPLRFEECRKRQLLLSETELNRIQEFMDRCVSTQSVLIVDPNDKDLRNSEINEGCKNEDMNDRHLDLGIVSVSQIEQTLQDQLSQQQHNQSSTSLLCNNPLVTPILLALQGVSRHEREAKISFDGVIACDSSSTELGSKRGRKQIQNQLRQKCGQYICTGYDMYSFYEPNVFEAMACLHSRLRRLIYFIPKNQSSHCPTNQMSRKGNRCISNTDTAGIWGHGLSKHDIHHLSGTNHTYRAFEYRQSSYDP